MSIFYVVYRVSIFGLVYKVPEIRVIENCASLVAKYNVYFDVRSLYGSIFLSDLHTDINMWMCC